jgi:plastocyanin
MANIKISQLPVLANPVDATRIPVLDSGANKTVSASALATYVNNKITSYTLPAASTSVLGGVKIDGSTITINGSGQLVSSGGGSNYTLPTASTSVLGGVKIDGSTITLNGSNQLVANYINYSLPTASTSVLGGVKIDGSTITLNGSNQLVANYTTYTLPTASTSVLGGVKIDGSTITLNGSNQLVANYTTYTLPTATTSVLGGVKVDGSTITINGSGVIAATGAGAVVYKGTWNASTNSPTLVNGTGTAGFQYAVSVGGTVNFGAGNITFSAGDFVLYSGTVWQQIAAGGIAAAGTLTGTVLASNVVSSSLTSVGTLTNLTVTNTITGSVSGNAATVTSISANTLTSSQVTTALGFTPYSNANPNSYITSSALTGYALTSAIPTNNNQLTNGAGYITGINSSAVTTALGFTPYNATNPSNYITSSALTGYALSSAVPTNNNQLTNGAGYITGINSSAVTTALGFTPVAASSVIPAITRLDVTNSGSTAYLFNNQYSGNNPTLYAISGTTIAFNLNVSGHPFLIRFSGANYDTGLIHVATDGTVSTGTNAQGKTSGTLYWQIPQNISGAYGYLCQLHGGMIGVITVKQISSLP